MKNEDLLLQLGKFARDERDVVRAPTNEASSQLEFTALEDIELYQKLAAPLSDDAMDRVLERAGLGSWPSPPSPINAPSLGSETRPQAPPPAEPPRGKPGTKGPPPRSRWSRLFRGAGLAVPLVAVAVVAAVLLRGPDPFPPTELTAILRDGEPLAQGAPIRLAVQRSENSVVLKLTPEQPIHGTVDSKVFVEGNGVYFDIASRASVDTGGDVSVEVEITGISRAPAGPGHLVVFVGREGHLPTTSDEAKIARSTASSSSPYRMFVRDILVAGNEDVP